MQAFEQAVEELPPPLKTALLRSPPAMQKQVWELRLRAAAPLVLCGQFGSAFLQKDGTMGQTLSEAVFVSAAELQDCFHRLCSFSVHTHQQDIVHGFVTTHGGHRVGICGKAVCDAAGQVVAVRDISSLNLRIARQYFGCAAPLEPLLKKTDGGLLLAGPPSSGKTTMLRDLALRLSDFSHGNSKVCVVDTRQELIPMRSAVPQMQTGFNCDVLAGYPKALGMEIAVRAMSPAYLLCDELLTEEELEAVRQAASTGVRMIASVHAANRADLLARPLIHALLATGAFCKVVLLKKTPAPCTVETVFDTKELQNEMGTCTAGLGL